MSDTEHLLFCEGLTGDDGIVSLFAVESEQFGSFTDVAVWPPGVPPETSNPGWVTLEGEVDFAGSSVSGSVLLVEFLPMQDPPFGDPVGEAEFTATLTPDGDAESYSFRDSFGNQVFHRSGTVQVYSVEGSLTMPTGATYDLGSCTAFSDSYTQFSNAPASSVARFSSFDMSCGWETENGFVGLFAAADEFGAFADLFIVDGEDEYQGFPAGPLTLTTETFEASFEIVSATEGGDPVGSATASASLTRGGRINERFVSGASKTHIVGQEYLVDGSLTVTLGDSTTVLVMDETSCSAADITITDHFSARQGPRGRPLPNDLPENALPIGIGETVTVRNTGGTAEAPEAPCVVSFPDGDFEAPIAHTAWWTLVGTGSPVTVDTAGSDFDTVVGVYVDDGGALTQVGCVDDVDSLQARITVDTDAGVTYFVQVGGFAGDSGSLVLSVE